MAVSVVLKSVFDDKGIKQATRGFTTLGNSVSRISKTLLGGAAFAALGATLMKAGRAAAEDAKSQALLANQLRNTLNASDSLIGSVEQSINKMSMSAAVADDELRPAFSQLVRVTGDAAKSQELLQIALDVSAGTGRDLNSVTIALGKAYQGNTTALSRLGIKAQDGVDIFEQLKTQFDGAAEAASRNDPFQRLTVTVGELQEQIGQTLLPYLNDLADYLASAEFSVAFTELSIAIGEAITQIDTLFVKLTGSGAATSILNFLSTLSIGVAEIGFFAADAADTLGKLFSGDFEGAGKNMSTYLDRYFKFVDGIYAKQKAAATKALNSTITAPAAFGLPGQTGYIPGSVGTTQAKTGAKATETQFQKVQKIIKTYQEKLVKAEESYTRAKFEINREYNERVTELDEDYIQRRADIIQSSIDRLRSAFATATQIGLGDLFQGQTATQLITSVKKLTDRLTVSVTQEVQKTTYSSVDDIINGLSARLAASRTLLENASKLASAGFSQTFIEQVVETGTDTGNALASAILGASPEQQAALKKNFLDLEEVSETGIDTLAKSLNSGVTLATRELNKQLTDLNKEYNKALEDEYKALQTALADAGYAFTLNVNGIKTEFSAVIDELDGKFGGLGKTIDALLAKMAQLSGGAVTDIQKAITDPKSGTQLAGASIQADVAAKNIGTAAGLVIDSAADVAGSMAYIQARIDAANKYIKSSSSNAAQEASARASITGFQSELANLKAASASEAGAAGTVININVKTDTTQSAAMVGKTIGNVVTKYTTTGGKVLVSGQQ